MSRSRTLSKSYFHCDTHWINQKLLLTPISRHILHPSNSHYGLPKWLSGKETSCQCRRWRFNPWVEKIPWRRKWQHIPVFLLGKSHGQRSLVSYSPWGHKQWDTTEWLSTHTNIKFPLSPLPLSYLKSTSFPGHNICLRPYTYLRWVGAGFVY